MKQALFESLLVAASAKREGEGWRLPNGIRINQPRTPKERAEVVRELRKGLQEVGFDLVRGRKKERAPKMDYTLEFIQEKREALVNKEQALRRDAEAMLAQADALAAALPALTSYVEALKMVEPVLKSLEPEKEKAKLYKVRGPATKQVLAILKDSAHPLSAESVWRRCSPEVSRHSVDTALSAWAKSGRCLRFGERGSMTYALAGD
jgi:hypothetical protein